MKTRPEWMSETDVLIIISLDSSHILQVVSPNILAYNLGISREHISRRLSKLTEEGYVEKVDKGKYALSDDGKTFLLER